jgi:hypothetical protein
MNAKGNAMGTMFRPLLGAGRALVTANVDAADNATAKPGVMGCLDDHTHEFVAQHSLKSTSIAFDQL